MYLVITIELVPSQPKYSLFPVNLYDISYVPTVPNFIFKLAIPLASVVLV